MLPAIVPFRRQGRAVRAALVGATGVALACGWSPSVEAARIEVAGADSCVEAVLVDEQASDLLGRPLASVEGVDFSIHLARLPTGKWRMRLDSVDVHGSGSVAETPSPGAAPAPPAPRSRMIQASTCAELADAAAVAIAMSVRALPQSTEMPAPTHATGTEAGSFRPAPSESAVSSQNGAPVLRNANFPARTPAPGALAFAVSASVVGDSGALPGSTVGGSLGASMRLRRLQLGLAATWLAEREKRVAGEAGGRIGLVFGAAEGCVPVPVGPLTVLGCAAYELGHLSAEGVGLARSRFGGALWQAVRGEAGVRVALGTRSALVLRAGASVPVSRPFFSIDSAGQNLTVYRPAAFSVRGLAGLEIDL